MPQNQNDVLMVSYWFPHNSNQTWRSFHLFVAFQKYFRNVTVLSTGNRKHAHASNYGESDRFVVAVPNFDYRTIKYLWSSGKTHVEEQFKSKNTLKIYNLFNSFPINLLIGEGGLLYIITGYFKARKLIKNGQVAFLFSTFRPYSDHAIAYLLKIFRPNLFWVADFRDLHLDPALKETYFPSFQKWCNRKILAKANVVTTVSKGLAEHLKPFHNNVVVLRNGIGDIQSPQIVKPRQPSANCFTITYTGSMFRDLRKPDLLLEALSELLSAQKIELDKVQIRYAGKDTATWMPRLEKLGLNDLFHTLGNVSHEAAVQLQQSSHINLLLTYATPELKGNATGKLYEYLAALQPILLLVNGCRDEELEEIFEETNAGLIAYTSLHHKDLVKEFILDKYNEWQATGDVAPAIQPAALGAFHWENMLRDFLEKHYFN